jgi:hypothetical protein
MEIRMKRTTSISVLKSSIGALVGSTCVLMCATVAMAAQPAGQYQGISNPPPNDTIVTSAPPEAAPPAKPSPAQVQDQSQSQTQVQAQPQASAQAYLPAAEPSTAVAPVNSAAVASGTDDGIVQVAPDPVSAPALSQRAAGYDPDGDIVHPAPLGPNQLGEGTTIRARLLERISTADSRDGDRFHARVASDVLQAGQVLIPAGAEIDGRIEDVSSGHFGGHGSMNLVPETVTLPDGSRFRLYAQVTGTPGARARVGSEGEIAPASRLKKDGIEYGGAVGAGAVTGAALGGPAGALAGTIVGAGVITAHLMIDHPQATLDEGSVLLFSLTETLNLVPAGTSGN